MMQNKIEMNDLCSNVENYFTNVTSSLYEYNIALWSKPSNINSALAAYFAFNASWIADLKTALNLTDSNKNDSYWGSDYKVKDSLVGSLDC